MPYQEPEYERDFVDWERRVSVGMGRDSGANTSTYEHLYKIALFGGDNLVEECKKELERRKGLGEVIMPPKPPGKAA
jgi:hypothetical protein